MRQFIAVARISYPTGIKWVNEERILARRNGSRWEISQTELEHYLQHGTRQPTSTFQFPSAQRALDKRKQARREAKATKAKGSKKVTGATFR